ncbi:putative Ig domain-containing protein [Pseudovibrio denitrificans]|uniref:putative Ig domain-containing protein n=1 Tax=Pseudovibrio denitrificans TaxID=258256 RepID=UPI000FFB42B0|nr:putative Ig domain-containing protein [Pseudovibrio denitrificans]
MIEDFASGDAIKLDGTLFGGLPQVLANASQQGSDTLIAVNDNSTITLKKVQKSTLHANDFVFANQVNSAPVLASTIPDRSVNEDNAWSYTIPAGTFTDPNGDALTLSARLSNNNALPSWLSFNGSKFTGTPPANYNGQILIKVTASDGSKSASDVFKLTVKGINDAPVRAKTIPDQTVNEDSAWNYTIPAGTFTDPDGDALTLSAKLSNNNALPSWLSFNGSKFTGTPPANYNGQILIKVTASDGSKSASDVFKLTVKAIDDAPVRAKTIPDRSVNEDSAWNYTIPAGTFTDPDGDALTLSARLSNNSALPSWLSFNGSKFTGTPPLGSAGELNIKVVATARGKSAEDTFKLTITSVNQAPELLKGIADQYFIKGGLWALTVPLDTFTDPDGDYLTLTARLSSNQALPSWLSFNGKAFLGRVPTGAASRLAIKVIASDGNRTTSDTFDLHLSNSKQQSLSQTELEGLALEVIYNGQEEIFGPDSTAVDFDFAEEVLGSFIMEFLGSEPSIIQDALYLHMPLFDQGHNGLEFMIEVLRFLDLQDEIRT